MRTDNAGSGNKGNSKVKRISDCAQYGACAERRTCRSVRHDKNGAVGVAFKLSEIPDDLYAICVVLAKKHGTSLEHEMLALIAKGVGAEIGHSTKATRCREKRRTGAVSKR